MNILMMLLRSENMLAIPLNKVLEKTMIPSVEKVGEAIGRLLDY